MSQKKQRPPAKPQARPAPSQTASLPLRPARDYSLFITLGYFIIAFIGVLHHEMWRDEFQAWLVARDSHSFTELLANNKYEGHPLLWYTILYGLTALTENPIALQFLNLAFAVGAVYLFSRYAPFNTLQKILFALGYYVLFEYAMIARYHTLALFLALLFCVLYKNRQKNIYWMFFVLFLLANASLINNVLAIAMLGILVFDFLLNNKKEEWKGASKAGFAAGVIVVLTGMTLSAIAVLPEEDNMFNPSVSGLGNADWIAALISRIDNAFFLFRDIDRLPRWMIISEIDIRKEPIALHAVLSLVFLAFTSVALLRRPLGLLFYWAGTLGLLFVYGVTFLTASRYMGHLFVVWVAAFWLSEYFRPHLYSGFGESLAKAGTKMRNVLVTLVFLGQLPAACAYYITDLERPFSASRDAADFLREQKLDQLPILGTIDFGVSPFSGWLNKPIFYPEIKQEGTYVVWDSRRKVPQNFGEVIPVIDSLMRKEKKMLVITNYTISFTQGGAKVDLEHDFLTDALKIDLLKRFERSMVPDENYSLYLVERVK